MIGLSMVVLEGKCLPTKQIDSVVPIRKISEHLKPILAFGLGVLVIGRIIEGEYKVQEIRFGDRVLPIDALELLCESMGISVLKEVEEVSA